MFSYFHAPTSYFELMPATAAAYFVQLVNVLGAGGVFVIFRTYASTTRIMAVYLALSTAMLLYRVPLGMWAAAAFTKLVARNQRWGPYLP